MKTDLIERFRDLVETGPPTIYQCRGSLSEPHPDDYEEYLADCDVYLENLEQLAIPIVDMIEEAGRDGQCLFELIEEIAQGQAGDDYATLKRQVFALIRRVSLETESHNPSCTKDAVATPDGDTKRESSTSTGDSDVQSHPLHTEAEIRQAERQVRIVFDDLEPCSQDGKQRKLLTPNELQSELLNAGIRAGARKICRDKNGGVRRATVDQATKTSSMSDSTRLSSRILRRRRIRTGAESHAGEITAERLTRIPKVPPRRERPHADRIIVRMNCWLWCSLRLGNLIIRTTGKSPSG